MADSSINPGEMLIWPADRLADLFHGLRRQGFTLAGPQVRDGELVLTELASPRELPVGWTNTAAPGVFRLERTAAPAFFGVIGGQQSWKQFFYPPRLTLWEACREGEAWRLSLPHHDTPAYALIGVRACDLSAIRVHDRTLLHGPFADPVYRARREAAFIVAVNCTRAVASCFCASLGTGPRATQGFDLALTERVTPEVHEFLVEAGSPRGAAVLQDLGGRQATPEERGQAAALTTSAAAQQIRGIATAGLQEFLYRSYAHPRWEETAARCLSCANCTLVCPTCFCHTVEDDTDIPGYTAVRRRRWDSCFTVEFSYIHGGALRPSVKSRYRQWLTHKLATWVEQFGCLGCVGCGRCLTWCPVGIDLTEEVEALRAGDTQE